MLSSSDSVHLDCTSSFVLSKCILEFLHGGLSSDHLFRIRDKVVVSYLKLHPTQAHTMPYPIKSPHNQAFQIEFVGNAQI